MVLTPGRHLRLLLAAGLSSACTGWKTQSVTAARVVAERRPHQIRVTRQDGSRVVLDRPEILGDTLFGHFRDPWPKDGRPRPAVALADVRGVAIRRLSAVGTAALILTTAALTGVVALAAAWSNRAD